MKSSNKNIVKGAAKQAKGRIKQAAGKATGSARLKRQGRAEAARGKVRRKVGHVQKDFERAASTEF
jgi:uncharacterized protein YjbJ (UPF0337 family)